MSAHRVIFLHVLVILQSLVVGLFFSFKPDFRGLDLCRGTCESNLTYSNEGGSDLFCDKDCSIQQCHKGCSLYQDAVHTSCQKVCASSYQETVNVTGHQTPSQDEMRNCIQGCIFALGEYSEYVKVELGNLYKPDLVRSSLGHSSLTLTWDTIIMENVTYKVHKKHVDLDRGWHLHSDTHFRLDGKIELKNLHPYVTYKFKVLALLTSLPEHILQSPETVPITTKAFGAPSAAPQITSLTTPSPRVISLTWTPPTFTNGKLLSYRIYVQAVNHPLLNLTTIEVPVNSTSWLLSQLQSSQKYVISLSAWNAEGEGPKSSRTITTPNPGNLSAQETPYLILGVGNKIVKRNILDVINYAPQVSDDVHTNIRRNVTIRGGKVIYVLKKGNVKDISLHVSRQLIFATDSSGRVTLISLAGDKTHDDHYPGILDPGAISVDWLADRVYLASRDRIYSCPVDRDLCVVVIEGLPHTARDINVDPINGFLYYVITGKGQGLYRLDLGEISYLWDKTSKPSTLRSVSPELIIPMDDLLTHVIDFYNVHLYLVNDTGRTMMAAFLDGSNIRPFHDNTINPAFHQVSSIVFYNQTFIWTDKRKMYIEEYESLIKKYRHNDLLFFSPPYTGINVFHPNAQPTPVPSSAPDQVEGLFTRDRANIRWKPPPLLQYQGWGAWNSWTYELQLWSSNEENELIGQPKEFSISGLALNVTDLEPETVYIIRVRARSHSGLGPWSKSFIGRTLKQDGLRVLMGLAGGQIVETDITDGTQRNIVNFFSDATDIAWHDNIVLWVTTTGSLSIYNKKNQQKRHLTAARKAYCVAYDWLGGKIYWSEPNQGVIRRTDINGITSEYIRQTSARDIAIDAVRGRLYWATQHSIETSQLNGDDHQEMFNIPYFSGRHVISLTLDFESEKVLWYIKGYDTQSVYVADLIPMGQTGHLPVTWERLGDFKSISSTSGLQYFSQRLFWRTEQNSLVVGDSQCNYTSAVSFHSNLTSFAVIHPSLHAYPANIPRDKVQVLPDPIRSEDIKTIGDWSNFNLTWPRSTEVTYGTVFYKVFVEVGSDNKHFTTSKQWSEMSGLSPYTQLVVSIQPYTYWGYADPTTVSVRSPMSKPTAPLSPEVYVIQHKNATANHQSLAADFRWMTPQLTNGIIKHHLVYHWMGNGPGSEMTVVRVKGTARHFILTPLVKSQTYHFKVVACTEAGCGPESVTKTAVTDALNPIPTLLVASKQGLALTEMDIHLNSTWLLSDIKPQAVTFLAQEDPRVFWIDATNKLYENTGSPFDELVDLNGTGHDLTIDWISRTLYTVESSGSGESNIMQFNIDRGGYSMLVSRSTKIGSIIADPYNSAIFWTEVTSEGQGQIMSADITTGETEVVLGASNPRVRRSNGGKSFCSCSEALDIAPAIAMDYKGHDGATEIVFAEKISGGIYSSDINGCHCALIFKPTPTLRFGLPPSHIAVDHLRVSWYNETEGKLYSISKATGQGLIVQDVPDVQDILAYGSHLQPLPDSQCLDPGAYNSTIKQMHLDSTSIHLRLSAPIRPTACLGISAPQDKYTIYYRKAKVLKTGAAPEDCRADPSVCQKQESYTTYVELNSLEPYTLYLIQVAVSNYYTEYLSEAMSQPLLLKTKFGVPQAARDVVSFAFTPEKISVKWLPPLRFNGPPEHITYLVQFSTFTTEGHIQIETENVMINNQATEGWINAVLKDLEPDHTYDIKVQTCTANRTMCNATEAIQTHTFMTPSDITFVEVTPHSIEICWRSPPDNGILRHQVIYAEVKKSGPLEWLIKEDFPGATENYTEYKEEVTGLKPNTLYAFRIKANYRARPFDESLYIWPPEEKKFTHRTAVFHPDQPPPPVVKHLKTGAYEVRWEEPNDNGASIKNYVLEYRNIEKGTWNAAYNGSVERWLVETSKLEHGKSYIFRVAAVNTEGMGAFSVNSSVFLAPYAVESRLSDQIIIGIIVGIIALIALIILAIILVMRKRHEKIKTQQFIIRGPDTELATLRELPHTTFQQSNTLYAISIQCTDEEIAKLPHFSRNQLVLTMFLGSGAFGEVFEGMAKNILGDSTGETKCAVKTLRKSASDHEKEEFLKEALLMKNFQHEHILSLLGVCLDNDPQFIIMELMEGGDLLSFLRSCRATSTMPAKLLLPDLVKICVNVARGCKYLEDMHFVHRDLAARNCLVSTKSPADMTVKIGDFGLARDIYKNDYYRKEGEGLLPVRWMSPESLVDGFFTTQSDIWAFGVLMWEVVTLGQQPYPARTNIEVLHFVREGGKLERPDKCADDMYSLMRKCWSFNADNRPSFASLLENLEMFQKKCSHMTAEEIAQLSPTVVDVSSCMTHHPSSHQNNRHRPLPLPPLSLEPPPHVNSQLYYSHPWDMPTPYSKPWSSSYLENTITQSNRNLEFEPNPIHHGYPMINTDFSDYARNVSLDSSLYQLPNLNPNLADLNAQKHDYCQPSANSFLPTSNSHRSEKSRRLTTMRIQNDSRHSKNKSTSPEIISSNLKHNFNTGIFGTEYLSSESSLDRSTLIKSLKKKGKRKRVRKIIHKHKNISRSNSTEDISCPLCLAETARKLSERVPYVSMNLPQRQASLNQDENCNDLVTKHQVFSQENEALVSCYMCNHEKQVQQISTRTRNMGDDRSLQNLAILEASRKKIGRDSIRSERHSPDEGIWSPSMSNYRKKNSQNSAKLPIFHISHKTGLSLPFDPTFKEQKKCNSFRAFKSRSSFKTNKSKPGLNRRSNQRSRNKLNSRLSHPVCHCTPSSNNSNVSNEIREFCNCMGRKKEKDFVGGHTNIAFIDEAANNDAVESMSEEEEEEEENEEESVTRGLFTPNSRTVTGGGSVRLTQSGKQKRLKDLLGSPDTPEKLVVDLTKIGRKRTHSLEDSKQSTQYSPSGANSRHHFPAAGEYDHNGYLEPRGAKGGGRYLELMNYAPELRYLRDQYGNPLTSNSGSAFTPVHVTRKGYHPSSVNYTLLSPEEEAEDAQCRREAYGMVGNNACGIEEPSFYAQSPSRDNVGRSYGLVSVEESPMYSRVCDDRRHYSTDSAGRLYGDYQYYPQASMASPGLKSIPQRKFSDQDLYSSTAPYRQRHPSSTSSSTQDHRYASVECNNNVASASNGNFNGQQGFTYDNRNGSVSSGSMRNRHGSGGSYHPYAKPGLGYPVNGNVPVALGEDNSKLSSSQDMWTNNLDDVFFDNDMGSETSSQRGAECINFQGQGHHSSRSRGQVYPENSQALVGYESQQVSLV